MHKFIGISGLAIGRSETLSIEITGERRWKSVLRFAPVELPDLTILVGLNGSGKSQLLEAIERGAVSVKFDGQPAESQSSPLRIINDGALPPDLLGEAQLAIGRPIDIKNKNRTADKLLENFESSREAFLAKHMDELRILIEPSLEDILHEGEDVWRLGPEEVSRRAGASEQASFHIGRVFEAAAHTLMITKGASPEIFGLNRLPDAFFEAVAVGSGRALELTADDLQPHHLWTTVSTFSPPIAEVFNRYRELQLLRDIMEIADGRESTSTALSQAEFRKRYGEPPWVTVTEVLQAFGLPYSVPAPPPNVTDPTKFVLLDQEGSEVGLDSLSSGERVLLRVALSLLDYSKFKVGTSLPRLLLLDEMDASLHPEMVNRWLDAIARGVVGKLGLKCILTTHSPTTVALAPEQSLFEMRRGIAGPTNVSKPQAMNALTVGLPFLSIDYSGRRQIFTESDTDAEAFQLVESFLKAELALPRALAFISTGMRHKNNEQNAGCAQVRALVARLHDNGAANVRGVIDWDGKNTGDDRILVLAQNTHYALDNLLADPFLIGALMIYEQRPPKGIDFNFVGLDKLGSVERQQIADAVLAGTVKPADADGTLVDNNYVDGGSIKVPRFIQTMRGHALEDVLTAANPVLKKWRHRSGQLTSAVVKFVIRNHPRFCPTPIADLLRKLAG
ncbi:AAA family ATPase [Sphingomonas sp. Root241]|uniref:AAA family ATPase n=1 Tax=Sphingomonas sp. Root241 TaxID=1736501 RepID=UPI0006F6FB41|nr:AAA family ATPase [Sphingomonas sp. Root241]KRC81478.1 hypothetical protein ASE13_03545 [Sphingomonas sp. Root241]